MKPAAIRRELANLRQTVACTIRFGRLGKNRNVRAAVVLSILSSLLAILLAWALYYTAGKPMLAQWGWADYSDVIALGIAIVGGAIAALVAGSTADGAFRSAKFCESCKRYMGATKPKTLCLGELRALVRALAQDRLDVAGSLLNGSSGKDGEVQLFFCPSCSQGHLEVWAHYRAEWKKGKDKKGEAQSWLAASRELAATDVIQLREKLAGPKRKWKCC
jgi:hypothetical protein